MMIWLARLWARLRGRRYGMSMWTASGRLFYPLDPRRDEVFIRDIARGLANRCRYQGQIGLDTGYMTYTVAEHSVLVSYYAEITALGLGWTPEGARTAAIVGLLHDASEAYIADVARPLKYSREMRPYLKIEARVERVIYAAIGLRATAEVHELVKSIDNRILVDEIRAFMHATDSTEDELIARHGEPLECEIQGLRPALAEALWLHRYEELMQVAA